MIIKRGWWEEGEGGHREGKSRGKIGMEATQVIMITAQMSIPPWVGRLYEAFSGCDCKF